MKEQTHFRQAQESWRPPPELCGSTPRQLKWTSRGVLNLVLSFVIVFFGFGLVFGVYEAANQDHRLKQEGKETDAIVTRTWRESMKTIHYKVAYEFSAGGQTVRGESEIPHRKGQALTVGSHMPVKYVPSEPAINRAAVAYERLVPYWVPLVAFVFWIGMIALAVFPIRKERRLMKFGQLAAGVITNNPRGRLPKYGYVVKYEFQLPDGSTVIGKTQRDAWFHSGQTVCVIYDPKRPRRNGIYPLRLSRIRQ
jgi:Protein of unknown function (DUF3592)